MEIKAKKKLDNQTIRSECSQSSFKAGKAYFDAGRVTGFQIEHEQSHSVAIAARVKGSHAVPYKQLITLKWNPGFEQSWIIGRCSCPIGYNCKHVAAACFEYQARTSGPAPEGSPACLSWLESLNSLEEKQPEEQDPNAEFLAYVVKPFGLRQELTVEFLVTKRKKTGGFNKGRNTNLYSLNFNFATGYNVPAYIQPIDEEILKLLISVSGFNNLQPQLVKNWAGGAALEKMLGSGRLFWENLEGAALRAGEPRHLDCHWQTDEQGNYRLGMQCQPAGRIILSDPPYYLDQELGVLGLLNSGPLNIKQLRKLAEAPAVPPQYAEQFSQRLIVDFPHIRIPAPAKVSVGEIDDLEATPHLVLQGQDLAGGGIMQRVKLGFDYGPYFQSDHQPAPYAILHTDNGYVRLKRDADFENRCIEEIRAAGFHRFIVHGQNQLYFYYPAGNPLDNARHWREFLEERVPELQRQGWRVETGADFQMNFFTPENWRADIEESGNDWFEMRFTLDVNGQSMPMLPLLLPAMENYEFDALPEILTLPLDDYNYVTLPSEKIKPVLAILFEMFGSIYFDEQGGLKLSRFDAAGLADLESHAYGLFSVNGGEALREIGRKIKNFTGVADVAPPANFNAVLRNYQQIGLNWLQFLREYRFGGILADDMGLGKTLQALTHLLVEKQSGRMTRPSLIIAPTSLMSNWRREAARFTPDLRMLILQGADRKQQFGTINDYDLLLSTYPLLPRDEEFLTGHEYYYLILDEAQIVKNPNAKAAKIVRQIQAEHRLCLTGTPMENHLGELWTQFDFLMPGFLGDGASFKRVYRTPIETHGDADIRQRLIRRIAPFMLRRTKQEVVAELPPKTEIVRAVPLGPKQALLYESIRLSMERKVRQAIAEKGLARSHIAILDALLKLRQTCCDPRTLPLAEAKKVKESAKLELLMEMLPELLDEGHRILLFSQFTRMIALIEIELRALKIPYAKLTGQTKNRDQTIEEFKSGAAHVFLISLKAGGVGLNLTEADTVIVYDPWWNPAAENQAADRAYRIGQDKPVFVYKLITENTVEEKILAMQERKRALAEGVYQGGKKGETLSFTAEDLSALFQPL